MADAKEFLQAQQVERHLSEAVAKILKERPANAIERLSQLLAQVAGVRHQETVLTAWMQHKYLSRIGVDAALAKREPSEGDLQLLLKSHLMTVPFENLGQHDHPQGAAASAVSKKKPTLDVATSLDKIVNQRRGGFCWEINLAFCWLLRSLGYKVRLGASNVVTPDGCIPGHVVLLVDGIRSGTESLVVDPGFGDPVRAPVPTNGSITDDQVGETLKLEPASAFAFEAGAGGFGDKRFSHVLTRARAIGSNTAFWDMLGAPEPPPEPMPAIPVYTLNLSDSQESPCEEFQFGLDFALAENEQNPFHLKRICTMATATGYITLGKDYLKTSVNGVQISRDNVLTEDAYRVALKKHFAVDLN